MTQRLKKLPVNSQEICLWVHIIITLEFIDFVEVANLFLYTVASSSSFLNTQLQDTWKVSIREREIRISIWVLLTTEYVCGEGWRQNKNSENKRNQYLQILRLKWKQLCFHRRGTITASYYECAYGMWMWGEWRIFCSWRRNIFTEKGKCTT
jgi:hypothetical protein